MYSEIFIKCFYQLQAIILSFTGEIMKEMALAQGASPVILECGQACRLLGGGRQGQIGTDQVIGKSKKAGDHFCLQSKDRFLEDVTTLDNHGKVYFLLIQLVTKRR